jgi:hypothetical protein
MTSSKLRSARLRGRVRPCLFDRWNIAGGDVPTHHHVFKLDIFARLRVRLHGLNEANDLGVLSSASTLLLVNVVERAPLSDGLTEVDARLASRAFNVILPSHALHVDFQMQLSHTGDDGLPRMRSVILGVHAIEQMTAHLFAFVVQVNLESRVFLLEPIQRS